MVRKTSRGWGDSEETHRKYASIDPSVGVTDDEARKWEKSKIMKTKKRKVRGEATYKVCILSPNSKASSGGVNRYGRFRKKGFGAGAGENTVEGILWRPHDFTNLPVSFTLLTRGRERLTEQNDHIAGIPDYQ
jgi:hypothetical protein